MVCRKQEVLDRRTLAVSGGQLGQLCGFGFFPLFSLPALSCPEKLLGCFRHELRLEGFLLPEPTPTLLRGCCLPCVGDWKDFQSTLALLCWKNPSFLYLLYKGCRQPGECYSQQTALESRHKAAAPLPSSVWKKGCHLTL